MSSDTLATQAIKLKTGEVFPLVDLAAMIHQLSDFFTNSQKNYMRLISDGDGQAALIINNLDMKVKFVFGIPQGVTYDRMFSIAEMGKIVPNLINYAEFGIDGDYVRYKDGHFKINRFDAVEGVDEFFGTDEKVAEQDAVKFNINEDFMAEITKIFELLTMKSAGHNYFFSAGDQVYFGFSNIYVAKRCFEQILSTDIFTLKVLYTLLGKFKEMDFYKAVKGKNFYIASDAMYIEGFVTAPDRKDTDFTAMIFDAEGYDKVEPFYVNREFFYFIDTVNDFDDESSIVFSNDGGGNVGVVVNSKIIPEAVFTITGVEIGDSFVLLTRDLHKILKYIMKKKKDLDVVDFDVIHNKLGRFLAYDNGDDVRIILTIQ